MNREKEEYLLTAGQIREIDEIALEKQSNEKMIDVAMRFYTNNNNQITRIETEWWKEMARVHGFDISKIQYQVIREGAFVKIVKKEEIENE